MICFCPYFKDEYLKKEYEGMDDGAAACVRLEGCGVASGWSLSILKCIETLDL